MIPFHNKLHTILVDPITHHVSFANATMTLISVALHISKVPGMRIKENPPPPADTSLFKTQ